MWKLWHQKRSCQKDEGWKMDSRVISPWPKGPRTNHQRCFKVADGKVRQALIRDDVKSELQRRFVKCLLSFS